LAQMTSEPSTCKGTGAGLSLATAGERILHFYVHSTPTQF
jgi:hypothetical protein